MKDISIHDYVFLTLREGLDVGLFGSRYVVGTVIDKGEDIVCGETMYSIDISADQDRSSVRRVYSGYVESVTIYAPSAMG